MSEATGGAVCARHPRTSTRVTCVQCGTPICPKCMVTAPVGFKCPDCAKQAVHARGLGHPRQYVLAAVYGVVAAAVGAIVLAQVFQFGFLSWIAAGVAGYLIAEAVRRGASGNRADPFRYLAFALALISVIGGYVLLTGGVGSAFSLVGRNPFRWVTFVAAIVGAYRSTG